MCMRNGEDGVEQARSRVKTDEIVVHGAKITCSCAGRNGKANYIKVLDGHGIMENGNHCAHDGSCVPIKNIEPFSSCASVHAKKALTALAASAEGEEKKRYETALAIINHNEMSYVHTPVPCTLPLLDRWFDADEKKTVTDSMALETEIKQKIKELQESLDGSLKAADKDLNLSFLFLLFIEEAGEDRVDLFYLGGKLLDIKAQILELCSEIGKTKIIIGENGFEDMAGQLQEVKQKLLEIREHWETAYDSYEYLKNYAEYRNLLDEFIEETDRSIQKIRNWKEKEYHLITTKSFLVCRCGGIISFTDSGQDFGKLVDRLVAAILSMVTEFREHCQRGMVDYCIKEWDEIDGKWSSYKAAADGLKGFERMLLGPTEAENTTESSIYMELICHSFNDEMSKTVMSALALLSLKCNVVAFLLAFYALATMEETGTGAVDGISADISALESIGETVENNEFEGILTQAGAGTVVQFNNLYTIVTSIANFFYISDETWIENVRITVFTDSHAHVYERKLDKEANILGGTYVQMWTKSDYISGDLGRGLRWEEEPGVYVKRLTNKGDNLSEEGVKVSNENDMVDNIEIY